MYHAKIADVLYCAEVADTAHLIQPHHLCHYCLGARHAAPALSPPPSPAPPPTWSPAPRPTITCPTALLNHLEHDAAAADRRPPTAALRRCPQTSRPPGRILPRPRRHTSPMMRRLAPPGGLATPGLGRAPAGTQAIRSAPSLDTVQPRRHRFGRRSNSASLGNPSSVPSTSRDPSLPPDSSPPSGPALSGRAGPTRAPRPPLLSSLALHLEATSPRPDGE